MRKYFPKNQNFLIKLLSGLTRLSTLVLTLMANDFDTGLSGVSTGSRRDCGRRHVEPRLDNNSSSVRNNNWNPKCFGFSFDSNHSDHESINYSFSHLSHEKVMHLSLKRTENVANVG